MKPLFFNLTIALLFLSLSTGLGQHTSLEAQIDPIFDEWTGEDMPGGVVGIFVKGELSFVKAYGKASLEYDVPIEKGTIFNIASVSKQITAFSMILLEQQGKLSLDDDIRKHLPEVPDFGKTITIRHLLHHTSGLRNFQNLLAMAGWRQGESMTNEDLLRFLPMQKELNFAPGEEYLYCNTGFNIITSIVERLTDMSFQDWTQKEIFEPLGMTNTSYREDLEKIHKNTATSYAGSKGTGFRQLLKYWTYMGNGNVYTTVEDFAKWMNNFREPNLGGQKAIDLMVKPGILNNGEELNYGLGIGVGEYRGSKRYSHGGSVGGYRSNMVYFPAYETGVILFTNFSSANVQPKVMAIADIVLEDQFSAPKPERNNNRVEIPKNLAKQFDPTQFEPFIGKYFVDGVLVELTQKGDQGFIYAKGELPAPVPLSPSSDTTFFVQGAPLAILLEKGEKDGPSRILIEYGGDRLRGFQINQNFKSEELVGVYYSPELDTRYTLIDKDGQVQALHQRHEPFLLVPRGKDQLLGTAYFFSNVKVIRDDKDKIEGLRVSNGRVRNLWFEKIE